VAENCSTAAPELLVALQPVQLVSTVAVPGETENVPFEEVPDADPPQPASRTKIGTAPAASNRPGMPRSKLGLPPAALASGRCERLLARQILEGKSGLCGSVVAGVSLLNFSGAFLANLPAQFLLDGLSLDSSVLFSASAGACARPPKNTYPHVLQF
jgi:hypothetical protein